MESFPLSDALRRLVQASTPGVPFIVGVGAMLMRASIDAATTRGEKLIYLVGDEPYYRRFGFKRAPANGATLPGPVDPARFLVLELAEGALASAKGEMRPWRP